MNKKAEAFMQLMEVVYELRQKCPWDKEQTWASLRPLTIEELYELTDALIDEDATEVKKELGDVLLHVLFYAMIAEEKKQFDIAEVCTALREKLIRRHPHIYAETIAENAETVKKNWEQIKLAEGTKSVLAGVPSSLPSLVKSYRLQEKAATVGFDWDKTEDVYNKVKEELGELQEAVEKLSAEKREEEFGDLFFSLVNYARFIGVSPDNALEKTNRKFIRRFKYMEDKIAEKGLQMQQLSLAEMDEYWNEAKALERD